MNGADVVETRGFTWEVLRRETSLLDRIREGQGLRTLILQMLVRSVAGCPCFGFALGAYGGVPMQMLLSSLKVPILLLGTAAICFPALYILPSAPPTLSCAGGRMGGGRLSAGLWPGGRPSRRPGRASHEQEERKMRMEWRHYRPAEGHPDLAQCFEEAAELAAKIRPIIRKDADLGPAERLRDAARRAKALRTLAENLVVNRRRYREGNHALRPLYVIWTMLNSCNFRCTYCDDHQGDAYYDLDDPGRLDTEKGKRLLEVMRIGTAAIYWCGGEPTLRADLPELLDHAWRLGYFPNMINTNGSLLHRQLARPGWHDFLRQMDVVIVSLDGLDLGRLGGLWGTRDARQVFVNLLMLRELSKVVRFKLVVNTVIVPDGIEEAAAVLDLACDLGIWFVPVPVNVRHEPNRALLSDPRYVDLARRILDRKKRGARIIGSAELLRRLLFAEPYRCVTALKPHVWSTGKLCWPCRATANVKPVEIDLLAHKSFDEAYEAGRKLVSPDFFHGPAANQCGGECAWMQNYTTARYLDGILHPLGSGIAGEMFEFAMNRRGPRTGRS